MPPATTNDSTAVTLTRQPTAPLEHELTTFVSLPENGSDFLSLEPEREPGPGSDLGQDILPVTDFASCVAAFKSILGSHENFTLHFSSKTLNYGGHDFTDHIDIRDLSGASILKVLSFRTKERHTLGCYDLKTEFQDFFDSSGHLLMRAANFKGGEPTTDTILYVNQETLGFVQDKTVNPLLHLKVKTEPRTQELSKTALPTLNYGPPMNVKLEMHGQSSCFDCCYCGDCDIPGGIQFHSSKIWDKDGVVLEGNAVNRKLVASMERLSEREYLYLMAQNSVNSMNYASDLQRGIAHLHIDGNARTLVKIWILYASVIVLESSFETKPSCCSIVKKRIKRARPCISWLIPVFWFGFAFFLGRFLMRYLKDVSK